MSRERIWLGFAALITMVLAGAVFAVHLGSHSSPGFGPDELRSFSLLPEASGLVVVNPEDVFESAIPPFLRNNPEELAKLQRELQRFQDKTGIDPRSVKSMVIAVTDHGEGRNGGVVIATGSFDPELVGTKIATNFSIHADVTDYRGHRMYVERVDRRGSRSAREHAAVTFLDGSTLVAGTVDEVMSVVDAQVSGRTSSRANDGLIHRLGDINPNANVRFVLNLGDSLRGVLQQQTGNVAPLGQLLGLAGSIQVDLSGLTAEAVAQAETAQSANTLVNFVSGAMLIARTYLTSHQITADRQLMLDVLNQVRVTTVGPDVRIDLVLPAELIDRITAASRRAEPARTNRN